MNAWLLAALLFSVRGSAAVVETAGAAAPVSAASVSGAVGAAAGASGLSPIQAVPGVSVLAPSLNAAVIRAFPGEASAVPAGAVRLAPAAAPSSPLPAPAAPGASASHSPASAPSESIPPAATASGRSLPAAPTATRRRDPALDRAVGSLAARLDAAGDEVSAPLAAAGPVERLAGEGAAGLGRRVFDRSAESALLADGAFAPGGGAFAPSRGDAGVAAAAPPPAHPGVTGDAEVLEAGDSLRDAMASPPSPLAAARPGAFPAGAAGPSALAAFLRRPPSGQTPSSSRPGAATVFERLTLEFGEGLVVRVRSALGLGSAASPHPFSAGTLGAAASAASSARSARPSLGGAPVTSTEWLERRGLLESLSASEAAAGQAVEAGRRAVTESPRAGSAPAPAPLPVRADEVPAPALWLLAFLPAAFVLFKELL